MNSHPGLTRRLRLWALLAACACALALPVQAADAVAAPLPAKGSAFQLQGSTLDGQAFSTAGLRGKVVLVFYWDTDCAVCRSKMPELRANAAGWHGKPFQLVTVSVDRNRAAAAEYDRTVAAIVPMPAHPPVLWAGEAGYRDSLGSKPRHLPLSVLLDAQGRVVAHYEGRIAPEVWDTIADLIP
jgi:thiol-disulfide isomerase/thioredoxin